MPGQSLFVVFCRRKGFVKSGRIALPGQEKKEGDADESKDL